MTVTIEGPTVHRFDGAKTNVARRSRRLNSGRRTIRNSCNCRSRTFQIQPYIGVDRSRSGRCHCSDQHSAVLHRRLVPDTGFSPSGTGRTLTLRPSSRSAPKDRQRNPHRYSISGTDRNSLERCMPWAESPGTGRRHVHCRTCSHLVPRSWEIPVDSSRCCSCRYPPHTPRS